MAVTGWSVTDFLEAGAVATAYPLGISAWGWWPSAGGAPYLTSVGVNAASPSHQFGGLLKQASDFVRAQVRDSASATADSTTAVATSAWHSCQVAFMSTVLRYAWRDGGSRGSDTTAITPNAPDRTTIGIRHDGVLEMQAGGAIAEVAFWNLTGFSLGDLDAWAVECASERTPAQINADVGQPWSGRLLTYIRAWGPEDVLDRAGSTDFNVVSGGELWKFPGHPRVGVPWSAPVALFDPGTQSVMRLAYGGGDLYAVGRQIGGSALQVRSSSDKGLTWGSPTNIGTEEWTRLYRSFAAVNNVLHLLVSPSGFTSLSYIRSSNGGATWDTPIALSSEPPHRVVIVPDDSGQIHVASGTQGATRLIEYHRSQDGGATFDAVFELANTDVVNPSMWVDGNTVHVVWGQTFDHPTTPNAVYYRRSLDGGDTWQSTVTITTASRPRARILARDGKALIVTEGLDPVSGRGRLYARRSDDGGATWGAEAAITPDEASNGVTESRANHHTMRLGITGGVVHLYYINGNVADTPAPGTEYIVSQDYGASWSEPQLVQPEGVTSTPEFVATPGVLHACAGPDGTYTRLEQAASVARWLPVLHG